MKTERFNPTGPVSGTREQWVILFLCLLAAIHVFIYSAVFPFFNNVDEGAHFDLAVKYSHGHIPRKLEVFSDETVRDLSLYSASFYFGSPTNDSELLPPPWQWPVKKKAAWITVTAPNFAQTNYESSQPPLYYAATGIAWHLGGMCGLEDGRKLYVLRFLNIPVIILLVWLGWGTAKIVFPENIFPRLCVPACITFMPQSAFYAIQSDVLSPVFFGFAFIGMLRFFQAKNPDWRLGAFIGLAFAATFLTKMTNLPLLAVSIVALAVFALHRRRTGKISGVMPAFLTLAVCAGLPALAWMFWCRENYGDFTGSHPKVLFLGWTAKPLAEWLQHPLFTFAGAWIFLSTFISEFWQGELIWRCRDLSPLGANYFYEFITISLLTVALVGNLRRPVARPQLPAWALWFSFCLFASVVGFLIFVSLRFDFHDCFYPSRTFPYMISGRLALGALIPFMLLFACGLDRVLGRCHLPIKFLVLILLNLIMILAEYATNGPAFSNEYNWFHM